MELTQYMSELKSLAINATNNQLIDLYHIFQRNKLAQKFKILFLKEMRV